MVSRQLARRMYLEGKDKAELEAFLGSVKTGRKERFLALETSAFPVPDEGR